MNVFKESEKDHSSETIIKHVLENTGCDLAAYRDSTLLSSISKRLSLLNLNEEQYLELCKTDLNECQALASGISIHVSSFFRDPIVFEIIAQTLIPQLINDKKELRVWSAACSSGEEAYSIAILIQDAIRKAGNGCKSHVVFATDVDKEILKKAKAASYPRESLENTKLSIIDSHFLPDENKFVLKPEIKNMVHFSENDLLSKKTVAPKDSIFGSFDMVLCRNVMIYFSLKHQELVQQKLYNSLSKGGYLILGDSEQICDNLKSQFKTIDARNKIYQK